MFAIIQKIAGYSNTKSSVHYEASTARTLTSVAVQTYRYY